MIENFYFIVSCLKFAIDYERFTKFICRDVSEVTTEFMVHNI